MNNRGYYAFSPIFCMQAGEVSRIASRCYRTPQPNATSTIKTSVLILPCCSSLGEALHSSRARPGLPSPSSSVSTCQVSCCGPSVLWLLQDAAGDSRKAAQHRQCPAQARLPAPVGHWQVWVCLSFPLSFTLRGNPLVLPF